MTAPQQNYDIIIVGGYGHIGLPMGIVLADKGYQVGLYDIDHSKEAQISAGEMPFMEEGAEPLLKRTIHNTLHLVPDISHIGRADHLVITVGTPVDEYLNPSLLPILRLVEQMAPHLRPGQHLMLRSTVFPGTTQRLAQFFEELGLGEVDLSFCPERIVQGHAILEYAKLPQIISGMTPRAITQARGIFERLGQEIVEVEVLEAELTKLFSNAWRYIQFAAANQFYMIATENGVDFTRVHHALTYGYDRARDFPKAGFAAGPCLLKDTLQLSAFYHNNFMLGRDAMLINEGLPAFIVKQLQDRYDLREHKVGILGMAFKANIDDIRDALSYKLGKLLRFYGAHVHYSDEFAKDPTFIPKEELVEKCDIVILGVPHRAYRELVIPATKHVVDVWDFFKQNEAGEHLWAGAAK